MTLNAETFKLGGCRADCACWCCRFMPVFSDISHNIFVQADIWRSLFWIWSRILYELGLKIKFRHWQTIYASQIITNNSYCYIIWCVFSMLLIYDIYISICYWYKEYLHMLTSDIVVSNGSANWCLDLVYAWQINLTFFCKTCFILRIGLI